MPEEPPNNSPTQTANPNQISSTLAEKTKVPWLIVIAAVIFVILTLITLNWIRNGNKTTLGKEQYYLGYNQDVNTRSFTTIDTNGEFACPKDQTFYYLEKAKNSSNSVCRLDLTHLLDQIKSSAEIPQINFSQFSNLKELTLPLFYLKVYPNAALQFNNLSTIYLQNYYDNAIPINPQIWHLRNLQHLYISGTIDGTISPEIGQLTNLRSLVIFIGKKKLANGKFEDVTVIFPAQLGSLSKLETLSSGPTQFPSSVSSLERLKTLNLSLTKLKQFPKEISLVKNLESLSLAGNELITFPNELLSFHKLKNLSLSNNQLTQLPGEISQMTSLEILDLSDNQIKKLPAEVKNLQNLKILNLDNNSLEQNSQEIQKLLPHTNIFFLHCSGLSCIK